MVISAYLNKLFTILVKVVMPMRVRDRILLSAVVYLGTLVITLSFAKESWSDTIYLLFGFGVPVVAVYVFWYIKRNNVIQRLQRLKPPKGDPDPIPEKGTESKNALSKPEPTFEERKEILDARERDVEQKYQTKVKELTAKQAAVNEQLRDLRNRQSEIAQALRELQKYQNALERTEQRVLSWVKLREAEDIDVFNAMRDEADKYQKYAEISPDMDGFKFEEYTAALLRDNGYIDVVTTQKSRDFGADVTATYNGVRYVFQCKYYTVPVGIAAVQEIRSAKDFYSAHVAVVVTNSVFTKAAKILADEIGVILWDGEKLAELASNH